MEIGDIEVFVEEFQIGNITVELSIQEKNGSRVVICTARDEENRRLLKTPIMQDGEIKMYRNQKDAISDAKKKLVGSIG